MSNPEAVDCAGEECPICYETLDNGRKVVVLQCGGPHIVCESCCDINSQTNCPLCRREFEVGLVGVAVNYKSGKTAADAIEILD